MTGHEGKAGPRQQHTERNESIRLCINHLRKQEDGDAIRTNNKKEKDIMEEQLKKTKEHNKHRAKVMTHHGGGQTKFRNHSKTHKDGSHHEIKHQARADYI